MMEERVMIHEHLKAMIIKHRHKFPSTLYRGVAITEFSAEELRALICILGKMDTRDRQERARQSGVLNSLRTGGRKHENIHTD